MKSTARRLLVLATVVFVTGLLQMAYSQGQRMRMTPEQRAKELKEQLSLTDEQVTKVTKIFEHSQQEMEAKRADFQGDRDAMRQFMQKSRAKNDSLIKVLLTKEQVKKYEEIQKEQMQRMQQRMRNN